MRSPPFVTRRQEPSLWSRRAPPRYRVYHPDGGPSWRAGVRSRRFRIAIDPANRGWRPSIRISVAVSEPPLASRCRMSQKIERIRVAF